MSDDSLGEELPRALAEYFERTTVALSLADVDRPDMPLILANRAFYDLTGYDSTEVIGHNCRFLQGPGTTEKSHADLHSFVTDPLQTSGRFPIVNYRKDGTEFHNYVFMTRLEDSAGVTRYILASQFDLTSAVERAEIGENDARLNESLADMRDMSRGFGIAMMGSAQVLSDSVANLAQSKLNET